MFPSSQRTDFNGMVYAVASNEIHTVLKFTRGRSNLGFNNAKLQVMNLYEKPLRSTCCILGLHVPFTLIELKIITYYVASHWISSHTYTDSPKPFSMFSSSNYLLPSPCTPWPGPSRRGQRGRSDTKHWP